MTTPTMFPWDKKRLGEKESLGQNCINSFLASYLTIAGYGFFGGVLTGPYPMLEFDCACGLGVGAFEQVSLNFGLTMLGPSSAIFEGVSASCWPTCCQQVDPTNKSLYRLDHFFNKKKTHPAKSSNLSAKRMIFFFARSLCT